MSETSSTLTPQGTATATRREWAVACSVGAALTMWVFARALPHFGTQVFGGPGDSELFVWSFQWIPYAIRHGIYPLTSDYMFATSGGINLAHNTFAPLAAVVLWPITALAGPVLSYNLYACSAPLLDFLAVFGVVRRFHTQRSALICAGIFAFSPLVYGSAVGHPQVNHLWAIIIGFALIGRAMGPTSTHRRRDAVMGGVIVALQLYIGIEMLALATIAAGAAALGAVVISRRQRNIVISCIVRWWKYGLWALGASVLIGLPFFATWLGGPERFFGVHQAQELNNADLANIVVPTRETLISPGTIRGNDDWLPFINGERGSYLGILLVCVLVWYSIRHFRSMRPITRWAVCGLFTATIMSLGPELHVWGHMPGVPMPWALVASAPVAKSILVTRFSIFAALFAGLIMAELLEHTADQRIPKPWMFMTIAGLVALTPATGTIATFDSVSTADAARIAELCGPNAVVVSLPRIYPSRMMLIQAQSAFAFKLSRGFGFRESSSEFGDTLLIDDQVSPVTRERKVDAQRQLGDLGATCVTAVDANNAFWTTPPDTRVVAQLLDRPCEPVGDICVWPLPRR